MNKGDFVVIDKDNFNEDEFLELFETAGEMSSKDFLDFVVAWLGFFNGDHAGLVSAVYGDKVIVTYFHFIVGWRSFTVYKEDIKKVM